VLEATGDLERAKGLEARNPDLLLIKATRLLPPLAVVLVEADASDAETLLAHRKLIEEMDAQPARGCYERALRRVHAKLINGVTTKGSRARNLPIEVIDPAEFARLDLRNIDAVDPRTGETVWHGLLISARELIRGNGEGPSSIELHPRPPKSGGTDHAGGTIQRGLSTTRAPPLSERDLRLWYEERVSELMAHGEAASGEADWEAAKRQFSGRVARIRLREVRNQFAPAIWKKQNRRSPGTAK